MKTASSLVLTILTLASLPLMAMAANAQMQPVSGESVSKLDSKSARVGEPVALKITQKTTVGTVPIRMPNRPMNSSGTSSAPRSYS